MPNLVNFPFQGEEDRKGSEICDHLFQRRWKASHRVEVLLRDLRDQGLVREPVWESGLWSPEVSLGQ